MKIIAWNCRGLGNGPAVRELLDLQKREDLFLSETRMDEKRMKHVRWLLAMSKMVVIRKKKKKMVVKDSMGRKGKGGGLVLFWKEGINVELYNYSKYHIDVEIIERDGFRWRLTGIYGEPAANKKENTWRLLRNLNAQMERPWLCLGDFNEILHNHEKRGGQPRNQIHLDRFKETLEYCGLRDLGYEGDKYTWRNHNHTAANYVKERLDRAVASEGWCRRFPRTNVINGDPRHSDHRPIIVNTDGATKVSCSSKGQNFRFEAKWLKEEDCESIVCRAWQEAQVTNSFNVSQGLRKVARDLKQWDTKVLGDLNHRLKSLKKEREQNRLRDISQDQVNREAVLKEKINKLEQQQDIYWKQRAHVNWLKGDKNTSYFHAFASDRKRKSPRARWNASLVLQEILAYCGGEGDRRSTEGA